MPSTSRRKRPGVLGRVTLLSLSAICAAVLAEGAYSLWTGRSLLSRLALGHHPALPSTGDPGSRSLTPSGAVEGPLAVAVDPHVGSQQKPYFSFDYHGVPARSDAAGLRVRLGPDPEPGSTRIAVLGDSVAFGFGVADDQTYAHQLEELLARSMDPDVPPPAAFTVATSGWTSHNAISYIRSNLARIDPDVVFFIPVSNDLQDGFNVSEHGLRVAFYDPVRGGDSPFVVGESYHHLTSHYMNRGGLPRDFVNRTVSNGGMSSVAHALVTCVTPESRRRWRELIEELVELRDRLGRRGGHLVIVMRWEQLHFLRQIEAMIHELGADLHVLHVFDKKQDIDMLDGDPHPNARCVRASALVMAEYLIEKGWVPGAGHRPLPPQDERYAERRAQPRSREEIAAWMSEYRGRIANLISSEIDLDSGVGFHQIYSEVGVPDLTVGRHVYAALANRSARELVLSVVRLPPSSRLYPLSITPTFNGVEGVPVSVPEPESETDGLAIDLTFAVPEEVRGADYIDVILTPNAWIEEPGERRSRLASFRLRSLRLIP